MTPEIARIAVPNSFERGVRLRTIRRSSLALLLFGSLLPLSGSFAEEPQLHDSATPSPPPSAAVPEDILSVVPAGTSTVVMVRDLGELDAKLTRLMERLSIPVSPYQFAKGWLEIVAGIDDHGPAAIAVLPVSSESEMPAKHGLVLILPTANRDELLSFLSPQPIEEGYTKVMLRGRESYAGSVGRFTVFGSNLHAVRSVVRVTEPLIDQLPAYQLKQQSDNDVSLWIDPASVTSSFGAGEGMPWLRGVVKSVFSRVKDLGRIQLAARFEQGGITVGLCMGRSAATRRFAGRDTVESLLRGLPNEPYVAAMGADLSHSGAWASAMVDLIVSSSVAAGVLDSARVSDLMQVVDSAVKDVVGVGLIVSVSPQGPDGMLGLAKVVHTASDGQTLLAKIDAIVKALKNGAFVDPVINRALEKLEFRRAVETSREVTVNHVVLDTSGLEGVDQEALRRAFGRDGLLLRIGVVDDRYVVMAFGGGLERFDEIVKTVRAGRAPLAADTGTMMSALGVARKRSLEAYVSVDRGLRLITDVSTAMGFPASYPQMPETNAPVALAMHSVSSSSTQLEVFIPTELLIAFKSAFVKSTVGEVQPGP